MYLTPTCCCFLQGNLILADSNYEVLTLLRSHRDDAKNFAIMARHPYPIHTIRLRQALAQEQLSSTLESADEKQTLRGMVLIRRQLQWKVQQIADNCNTCLPLMFINKVAELQSGTCSENMARPNLCYISDPASCSTSAL